MRLSGVTEWSVEYDELTVTVWVSTSVADYKLLSPAPLYSALWEVLQRKTALAARVIALLQEDPTLNFKGLRTQTIRCNAIPNAIQFRPEELNVYGTFLADQVHNPHVPFPRADMMSSVDAGGWEGVQCSVRCGASSRPPGVTRGMWLCPCVPTSSLPGQLVAWAASHLPIHGQDPPAALPG